MAAISLITDHDQYILDVGHDTGIIQDILQSRTAASGFIGTQLYSFDDKEYHMMRNAWMEANHPVKIGMFAACPDGDRFNVTFSDFKVTHLPDKVRTDWLNNNAE